jgi:transketolase N-terminal domain/subunit
VWTPVPVWLVPPIVACAWLIGYALALAIETRARRAFEATLSETELAQFNAYRAVLPWRSFANVVATDRVQVAAALDEIASLSDLSDRVRALRWQIMAARGAQIHETKRPR